MPSTDERIATLVRTWLERQERGEELTPEELCVECPELLDAFRRHIEQAIRTMERVLKPSSSSDETREDLPPEIRRPTIPGYEILEELGRGGMGVVYKARQLRPHRLVAIKMILAAAHASGKQIARFRAEAESIAQLKHPGIVQIHEVGECDGWPYFSMELIEGISLSQRISGQPRPPNEAAEILGSLARAVHYAHQQGIIHRDLKPANVLLQQVESDGSSDERQTAGIQKSDHLQASDPFVLRPKITDFGVAKRLQEHGLTQTEAVIGTACYMAPEQARGESKKVGPPADIYSLGAILYEMLTGRPPFQGATTIDTLVKVYRDDPDPPRRVRSNVPVDLDAICMKCLEKDSARRYVSAWALAEDLERFGDGEPILARPATTVERALKWAKRRPATALLTAVSVLVPVILMLGGTWSIASKRAALDSQKRELDSLIEIESEKAKEAGEHAKQLEAMVKKADQDAKQLQEMLTTADQHAKQLQEKSDSHVQRESLANAIRLLREHRDGEAANKLAEVPVSRRGWEWHWLSYETSNRAGPYEWLGAHDGAVIAGIVSKDGKTLVSSGFDGRLVVHPLDGGSAVCLEGGIWSNKRRIGISAFIPSNPDPADTDRPDCFQRLCWMRDGEMVAGVSVHGTAARWNLDDGDRIDLYRHDHPLTAIDIANGGQTIVLGDEQGTLIYRLDETQPWTQLTLDGGAVLDTVCVRPDQCVVGQESGAITLVSLAAGTKQAVAKADAPIWDLDLSADGLQLAAAFGNNVAVYLVDLATGAVRARERYPFPSNESQSPRAIHSIKFTPDGAQLAAGDELGRVGIWEVGDIVVRWLRDDQQHQSWPANAIASLRIAARRKVSFIGFAPDGNQLMTGGLDATLKRYMLSEKPGQTVFAIGVDPKTQFEPGGEGFLWSATADGQLAFWDSFTGKMLASTTVAGGAITALALAKNGPDGCVVATCADGQIKFWRRSNHQIESWGPVIEHHSEIRSVAIRPDASRVAAYDFDDNVTLWDVTSGESLATVSMKLSDQPNERAFSGRVGFSADGRTLAAAGPGQSFWLLRGETWDDNNVTKTFGTVTAGEGGTAIAWHPSEVNTVWAGDTSGNLRRYPTDSQSKVNIPFLRFPVAGIAFSTDGRRFAAVSTAGRVEIVDPTWTGGVLRLQSPSANEGHMIATGVSFDSSGHRLAVVHSDGSVVIWKTAPVRMQPIERPARAWQSSAAIQNLSGMFCRELATALDPAGNVCLLYNRLTSKAGSARGAPPHRVMVLARESAGRFAEEILTEPQRDSGPLQSSFTRSAAITLMGDYVYGAFRHPDDKGVAGGSAKSFMFRRPSVLANAGHGAAGAGNAELVLESYHSGFDAHLLSHDADRPAIASFSHVGHYLQVATWADERWQAPVLIGRQGDGLAHVATSDAARKWHFVFKPTRFNGDPSPLTYVRVNGSTLHEELRELVDTIPGAPQSIVALPNGGVAVLYGRSTTQFESDIVVALRSRDGWKRTVVLSATSTAHGNLVCDRTDTLYFAYFDAATRRVLLARSDGNSWTAEPVWQHAAAEEPPSTGFRLATLIGPDDLPVVIVSQGEVDDGWFQVFRLAK